MGLGKNYAFYLHEKEDLMMQELFKALKVKGANNSERIRNLIRAMYQQLSLHVYSGEVKK